MTDSELRVDSDIDPREDLGNGSAQPVLVSSGRIETILVGSSFLVLCFEVIFD